MTGRKGRYNGENGCKYSRETVTLSLKLRASLYMQHWDKSLASHAISFFSLSL